MSFSKINKLKIDKERKIWYDVIKEKGIPSHTDPVAKTTSICRIRKGMSV